jgi:hypothetical protein
MIQPVRSANPHLGYFLRGAASVVPNRTLGPVRRFVMGIVFAMYERTVVGMHDALGDAPTPSAMRQSLRNPGLTPKLRRLVDWKTGQNIRKALRRARKWRHPIVLAIDSTFKGTLSTLAWDLFATRGKRIGQHIFVFGVLVFPDGRVLPLRPLQKKRGRGTPTQVDLAGELVASVADELAGQRVVVTADSYFFAKKFLRAIRAAGFHYVIACKANTVLRDRSHLSSLLQRLRLKGSSVTLPACRGERKKHFSVALRHLDLRCGGTQAVVFSRPYKKRRARVKFLVSDLLEATAAEIARLYAQRWQIEVFFREAKMYLGLDQYRLSGKWAPESFALVVTLAYQFLHWSGDLAGPPMTTLAHIKELARQIDADNVVTIERGALTRHGRKQIRANFHVQRPSGAHASRNVRTPNRKLRRVS